MKSAKNKKCIIGFVNEYVVEISNFFQIKFKLKNYINNNTL